MTGIIILNYQTWETSLKCMKSAVRSMEGGAYAVYLVDNASTEPMPDAVKQYIHANGVHFLQSKKNGGYASGNNIGIKKALEDGCDYLLISNNDILFREGAIQSMAAYLKSHPDTGIAGPKVVDRAGRAQYSCCSMRTGMKEIFQIFTAAKLVFGRKWKRYYCLDRNPDKGRDVYYVSGCCFMMSAACAGQITPLDEHTVLYDEELIIGIRMAQRGLKTHYCPKAVVEHRHGHTTDRMKPFMFRCISESGMYYCSAYLKAPLWQIFLLYQYRNLLYTVRSIRNKELRDYKKQYKQAVKAAWKRCRRYQT